MNSDLKKLGKVLDKYAQKAINGSGRICMGDYCVSGYSNGFPICVPCGEKEPPKE